MTMGIGSEGQRGAAASWIFIHGKNIVDRCLIVLFFGPFPLLPSRPFKRLNSAIFGLFFVIFTPPPKKKFLPKPLLKTTILLKLT